MMQLARPHGNWRGLKVFLTGHTGFKGSWLTLWLWRMGAEVTGYALEPAHANGLFRAAGIEDCLRSHHIGDIRDLSNLAGAMKAAQSEVVFHLAAQPLVRHSYRQPHETWTTNVIGTVNVLEAVRQCPSVKAVVVVTTDKCYENREWVWGYREEDRLGGHDPYSASKAATELVVDSYRKSFFADGRVLVATARAGNVIGGGDWSDDRLVPDAARSVVECGPLIIRNPLATRPWQHVLEPLHGYLLLARALADGNREIAAPFNFGPPPEDNLPVRQFLAKLQEHWPELSWREEERPAAPHEAHQLYLDSARARRLLHWQPMWTLDQALRATAQWYRGMSTTPSGARRLSEEQLEMFTA